MTKSKLTLIVDGNWLLMSRLPIINMRYIDDATMVKELKLMMIKSMNVVLRTFPEIDDIMFVSDGGSWRKDVPIPQFVHDKKGDVATYKGNREKSEDINWDLVFAEFNNFTEELKRSGIQAFHENSIEGDDWCWYLSRKLNENGTNVIIWTKDRDITQLCSSDNDGCFTIVWNKENGVFMKKDDDLTKFLLNPKFHANEAILNEIVNKATGSELIIPENVQIDKIIRGDAGDNVLPVVTRNSKTGTIVYRPTKKQLPEALDIFSIDDISNWVDTLLESKQWAGKNNEPREDIIKHFIYNRQMVVLDKTSYPENVLALMTKHDDEVVSHPLCSSLDKAEASILAEKNSLQSILDEI